MIALDNPLVDSGKPLFSRVREPRPLARRIFGWAMLCACRFAP